MGPPPRTEARYGKAVGRVHVRLLESPLSNGTVCIGRCIHRTLSVGSEVTMPDKGEQLEAQMGRRSGMRRGEERRGEARHVVHALNDAAWHDNLANLQLGCDSTIPK